jgi:hypothetical protein
MQHIFDIAGGVFLLVLGWMGMLFRNVNNRLTELENKKVDNHELGELKSDIKQILQEITDIKVEQAKWQGRQEQQSNNKRESF